jgi:hypothetical protein
MPRRTRKENPWLKVLTEQACEGRSGAAPLAPGFGPVISGDSSYFGN